MADPPILAEPNELVLMLLLEREGTEPVLTTVTVLPILGLNELAPPLINEFPLEDMPLLALELVIPEENPTLGALLKDEDDPILRENVPPALF